MNIQRPEDYDPPVAELEQRHKGAMLSIILTWSAIDVSLGYFASAFFDDDAIFDVAESLRRKNASKKMHEIIHMLKSVDQIPEVKKLSANLKSKKRKLELHSKTRDHVAHSKCIGCNSDDHDLIIFIKFEKVGDDNLAMYEVPIQQFNEAIQWGLAFDEWLSSYIHRLKHAKSSVGVRT